MIDRPGAKFFPNGREVDAGTCRRHAWTRAHCRHTGTGSPDRVAIATLKQHAVAPREPTRHSTGGLHHRDGSRLRALSDTRLGTFGDMAGPMEGGSCTSFQQPNDNFPKGDAMANSDKVSEVLRAKGAAMEAVEDPKVIATDGLSDATEDRSSDGTAAPSPDREERIRRAAYAAAERRGFEPGHETDDWLAAEREIDSANAAG